jgi:hypothetical protein
MRNYNNGSSPGAMVVRPIDSTLAAFRWVTAFVAVLMSLAISSQCSAQTLNLGPDSSDGIFLNNGGILTMIGGKVNGSVDENGNTINSILATISGGINTNAHAVDTPLTSGTNIAVAPNATSFTASPTGVSIFNLNSYNLNGGTMTINGGAGDTVVFKVGTFNLNNVTMKLSGLNATQLVFIGNNFTMTNSTVYGTYYNGAIGGATTLTNDMITGAVVAGNKGFVTSTLTTINAAPMTIAGAPETPTIMTAALGAFLIMGSSGVRYLRRRRCGSRAEFSAH